MRLSMIAGILLVVAGLVFFVRGGVVTSRRDVMQLGDLKVTAEEQHPIRPWVAAVVIASGIALVVVGARRRA